MFFDENANGVFVFAGNVGSVRFIIKDEMIVLYYFSNIYDEISAHYYSWIGDSFYLVHVDDDLMEKATSEEKEAFLFAQIEQMKK